jgi:hypothetical protein
MERTPVHDGALERFIQWSQSKVQDVRRRLDRMRLESRLAALLKCARDGEAIGDQKGDPIFIVFFKTAREAVSLHAREWHLDLEQLEAELPAYRALRALAYPPGQKHFPGTMNLVIAIFVGAFLLGIAGALVRLGFLLLGGGA